MLPAENPYAAPSGPIDKEETAVGFDPQLLAPSLGYMYAVGIIVTLLCGGYFLWCVYAVIWTIVNLNDGTISEMDVVRITTFQLLPTGVTAWAYGYSATRLWRYRKAITELILGVRTWGQFAETHRWFWQGSLILNSVATLLLIASLGLSMLAQAVR